jgi:hypothetical protein
MKFIFPYELGAISDGEIKLSIHYGAEFLYVRPDNVRGGWELVALADTDNVRDETSVFVVFGNRPVSFTAEVTYINSVGPFHFFAEVRP